MKKTLIALLAVSSVAMAVSLDEATIKLGNEGYDTQSGNFTVALTLNVAELRTLLEQGQAKAWGTDIVTYICNGTATGVTVNGGSNASGEIASSALYARWGNDTAWNPANGSDVVWSGSGSLADLNGDAEGTGWDAVASAGLVYSFGKTDATAVAFTLIGNDGSVLVDSYVVASALKSGSAGAAALTFDDSVAASYYFNDYKGGSEADMKALAGAVATASIPEPTTATLSLLALAGLAARRRRK